MVFHTDYHLRDRRHDRTNGGTAFLVSEFYQRTPDHVHVDAVLFGSVRVADFAHVYSADVGSAAHFEAGTVSDYTVQSIHGRRHAAGFGFGAVCRWSQPVFRYVSGERVFVYASDSDLVGLSCFGIAGAGL